jgi:predicted DNA binding CopG/RHH family protein
MAKPRFNARFTLRLPRSLLEALRRDAAIWGDDFADLIRNILIDHVTHRPPERQQEAERRWRQ